MHIENHPLDHETVVVLSQEEAEQIKSALVRYNAKGDNRRSLPERIAKLTARIEVETEELTGHKPSENQVIQELVSLLTTMKTCAEFVELVNRLSLVAEPLPADEGGLDEIGVNTEVFNQ